MNSVIRSVSLLKNVNKSLKLIRMSSYLIQDPKYSFLKELGLSEKNNGVFVKHGRWIGDGQVKFYKLLEKIEL